jgi:nucleoside-diphosphate-sugar epimerase
MTTLITGGTGFIVAEVVRQLIERGERRPVVFHVSGNTQRLDDVADQVELVQGDLANFSHVLDVVKKVKPNVIYHLGAMLSIPSDADPATAIHVNAMGTFHILEAARLFDVPQVLFSSSISTYGLDFEGEVIDDTTIQRPVFFYGATKLFCEHMGLFYKRKYGLDFHGVRYPSIVGPGSKRPGRHSIPRG